MHCDVFLCIAVSLFGGYMSRQTITFRLDATKKRALDHIAMVIDRDRSYVLNEAIKAYLETHQWQMAHIREGVRQADAGEFASEKDVKAAFKRWRR
jgi:RHH-type transcriptional regulator, rel operon repressor / antitoxin RelB